MMPGRHKVKRAVKSEPGGTHFFLNSSIDHPSECSKIMLLLIGVASYSTDVTWGCQRAPIMWEWTTTSEGAAMAGPPSPEKREAVRSPAEQPEAPRCFEVWYQRPLPLADTSSEPSPAHVPTASTIQYRSSRSRDHQ